MTFLANRIAARDRRPRRPGRPDRTPQVTEHTDDLVDEALVETFPASDAPWFMAASAVVGAPYRNGPSRHRAQRDGADVLAPSAGAPPPRRR
jgi:hypothetical protein